MFGFFECPKFNPDTSIPELSSQVFLITGGNAGLGLESALQLAKHKPSHIYLTARTRSKFDSALDAITKQVPDASKFISFVELDLASLASVKAAADTVLSKTDRLHVLMNNAGIMGAANAVTVDNYEVHFGTNHMGHALFTQLLLPLLQRTAEQEKAENSGIVVRIINVSSAAHQFTPSNGIDFIQVKTDMSKDYGTSMGMLYRYGQSKLANVLHAAELSRRYPDILSVSLHPGRVKTQILDQMYATGQFRFYAYFQSFFDLVSGIVSVQEGALGQLWAATQPKENNNNGAYYNPVGKESGMSKFGHDTKLAAELWDWQEKEFRMAGFVAS